MMATNRNITPLPPYVLTVYPGLHVRSRTMQWGFFREPTVQFSLDNAVQSYTSSTAHRLHDAVVMVNDQLFVGNILVSEATYDVAYFRWPTWIAPWSCLGDADAQTPLVGTVPGRAQRFMSRVAYAALRVEEPLTWENRICRHGRLYAKFCHPRNETEIEQAWREERGIDWERIPLLKAFGRFNESFLLD